MEEIEVAIEVVLDFNEDLAKKIKSGEIVGSFITNDGYNAEFVYISKSKGDIHPLLFVEEINHGVAIWVNKYGVCEDGNFIKMKCNARQAFKDGDVLVADNEDIFLYNGVINEKKESMECHCRISKNGLFQTNINGCENDCEIIRNDNKYVRFATEQEKGILIDKLRTVKSNKAVELLKTYFKEEESKDVRNLKPFDRVLVKSFDQDEWNISLFHRVGKDGEDTVYRCIDGAEWDQCIPYEGNEYLLNK